MIASKEESSEEVIGMKKECEARLSVLEARHAREIATLKEEFAEETGGLEKSFKDQVKFLMTKVS